MPSRRTVPILNGRRIQSTDEKDFIPPAVVHRYKTLSSNISNVLWISEGPV